MEHLMKRIGFQKIGLFCRAVGTFGNSFFYMGIIWYVLTDPINGTLFVGMISFLEGAMKFVGIPLGTYIEYHNKRTLLLISCAGMVLVQLLFSLVVGLHWTFFLCVALYVFHEVFQNLHFSTIYVYSVIKIGKTEYEAYNAKIVLVQTLVQLLGSVTAAFFFAWKGFMGFVLFDLFCYLLLMIPIYYFDDLEGCWSQPKKEGEPRRFLRDSMEGIKTIFAVKPLRVTIIGVMAVNVFMLPYVGITLPLRLREWMPGQYTFFFGFISSAFMIGMIAGSVLMSKIGHRRMKYFRVMCGILFFVGISLALLFNINIWLTICLAPLGGIGLAVINITASNAMTLLTPEEKLSRVNGANTFLGQAIEPAGSVLATSVCGVAGALAATVMAGASVAVIAVLAFLLSVRLGIHNMDAFLPESAQGISTEKQEGTSRIE